MKFTAKLLKRASLELREGYSGKLTYGSGSLVYTWDEGKNAFTIKTILVGESDRSKGVGSELMRQFLEEVDKLGASVHLLAAPLGRGKRSPSRGDSELDSKLVTFYQKFGFQPTGRSAWHYDKDDNPYLVPMMFREGVK